MGYVITFLEGLVSFISPCMLPMLPLYLSYFAGGADKKQKVLLRASSFVLGFTVIFTLMGVFAGTVGAFFARHQTVVNIVCGALVIVFGLSYMEIIPLNFFKGMKNGFNASSVISAFLFGIIYSVSLTPCVGAFLGAALMQASTSGGALSGGLLLVSYSLGLGVPFLISAMLIDALSGAFGFIKKHYKVINTVCGAFLILVGVSMIFGWMNAILAVFS